MPVNVSGYYRLFSPCGTSLSEIPGVYDLILARGEPVFTSHMPGARAGF
jgi:hypothetical protein